MQINNTESRFQILTESEKNCGFLQKQSSETYDFFQHSLYKHMTFDESR